MPEDESPTDGVDQQPPGPVVESPAPRQSRRRRRVGSYSGAFTTTILALGLTALVITQVGNANEFETRIAATKDVVLAANHAPLNPLDAQIQGLQDRWFGNPALYQPPAISNTDFKFFDVQGATQRQLIDNLDSSNVCSRYGGCLKDPANPSTVAWGLAGINPAIAYYTCYSPATTTIPYREYVVLPRWSPQPFGAVSVTLVKRWNALVQTIYIHEAGHVAIDKVDIADLNAQAHRLPTCDALVRFWDDPHVFDKLSADQNAYHARLRADCRPEIGCIPYGWMGW